MQEIDFKGEIWSPRASIGGMIVEAAAAVKKESSRVLSKAKLQKLSLSRVGLLNAIESKALILAELSRQLGVKPPSLLELLKKMKKEKLVANSTSLLDKRKVLWKPTEKGLKVLQRSRQLLKDAGDGLDGFLQSEKISQTDVEAMKRILRLLVSRYHDPRPEELEGAPKS